MAAIGYRLMERLEVQIYQHPQAVPIAQEDMVAPIANSFEHIANFWGLAFTLVQEYAVLAPLSLCSLYAKLASNFGFSPEAPLYCRSLRRDQHARLIDGSMT